jgi:LysR family transcriptional regulator, regulator for metE and metH
MAAVHTEMRHLQLVRAIAASGTLTAAGLALNLTQSALSHQLRDIESRLGVQLFARTGRRLALTPAGEKLLATAHEVLALVERAEDAVRQEAGGGRGLLRLTTECSTCYHWLPPLLKDYHRTHPQVEVRIDVEATDRPVAALLDGEIDLALVSDRIRDRRIIAQPLFEDEYAVVMRPSHPLAARPFVVPSDFAAETFLTYASLNDSTVYQRLLAPAGVVPARTLQVKLTEAIVEMAKAGMGIGVLPAWAAAPHVQAGSVAAVPLTRRRFGRTWSAATLRHAARLPHVRAFIDLLAASRPFAGARAAGAPAPRRDPARPSRRMASGSPRARASRAPA